MGWLALLVQIVLVAVAAPVLDGLLHRAAAVWRGEAGPPVAQSWRNLVRLWRKAVLVPAGASFVFAAAPVVSLAAAIVAALLVPTFTLGMATSGMADLLVIGGLFGVSRLAVLVAAYDSGSAVVAFASGRAAAARLGVWPVLLLVALGLLLVSSGTNVDGAAAAGHLAGALAGCALFGVAIMERDTAGAGFSGRHLAMVTLAGQVRFVAALSLAAALALPFGMAAAGAGAEFWIVGAACWVLKIGALGMVAAAAGTPRRVLAAAALAALIAIAISGVQGAA